MPKYMPESMRKVLIAVLIGAFLSPTAMAQTVPAPIPERTQQRVIGAFSLPPSNQCTSIIQEFVEDRKVYKVLIVVCRSISDSRTSISTQTISVKGVGQ